MNLQIKLVFSFIVLSILSTQFCFAAGSVSCKDENGQDVDWFYAYKLPIHIKKAGNITDGLEFLFITSNSNPAGWTLSGKNLGDSSSLIGRTILQAFISKDRYDRLILAYNDEPPENKVDALRGHAKGLVVADNKSGFWLIHSVPQFPEIYDNPDQYTFPKSGTTFGQSFLCVSVNESEINTIGTQLTYNEAHIYTSKISDTLREMYPNISMVIDQIGLHEPPYWNEANIVSARGTTFKTFAKHRRFQKELYEDWVAPILQTDLYVETWRHGPGLLASNCTQRFRVWNISRVILSKFNLSFVTNDDHSKWAVGATNASHWICVGDINRAEHQKQRGGGTVCQQSELISTAYRSTIASIEECELNIKI